MYGKIIFNIILIICLSIVQLAFISSLPYPLNNFNLLLVVLIFILSLADLKLALFWLAGTGFFLEVFSFEPFGVYLLSLVLTIFLVNFLLTGFFTNRSLYSLLALIASATLAYDLFFILIIYLISLAGGEVFDFNFGAAFQAAVLSQLILNSLAVLLIFYLVNFISRRLKPVFLIRSDKL